MADIDLSGLNIDQLTELVGKAQAQMASREKQRRKDLRSELERRVAADGYKMGDIFPELGTGGANGRQRRKMPAKFRNPKNPEDTWTGIGRSPKWVQAILAERGDRHGGVQGGPYVSDSRVGAETREHFTHPLSRSSVSKGCGFPIPTRVSGACVRVAWPLACDSASMGGGERSFRLARSTPSSRSLLRTETNITGAVPEVLTSAPPLPSGPSGAPSWGGATIASNALRINPRSPFRFVW